MSGTISSPGIGSGLNISSIVQQLVQADYGAQQTQIQNQQSTLNSELSAFGTINSDVSSIGTALTSLQNLSLTYAATSSDTSTLSATAQSGATAGAYDVNVTSLASAQNLASQAYSSTTSTLGTGTLTFQFGSYASGGTPPAFTVASGSSSMQITLTSSNDTLQGLAGAINQADFGVSATVINNGLGYQLALTSKSGTDNQLNISTSSTSLSGFDADRRRRGCRTDDQRDRGDLRQQYGAERGSGRGLHAQGDGFLHGQRDAQLERCDKRRAVVRQCVQLLRQGCHELRKLRFQDETGRNPAGGSHP